MRAPASSAVLVAPAALAASFRPVSAAAVAASSASAVRPLHTRCALRFASPAPQVALPGTTIDFNLADIGEGIAECEVLRWFIKEGDTIAQFDKVCEVQSDKANVEITSRYDGKVTSLKYAVGELAKVGKPLLSILLSGSPSEGGAPAAGSIDTSGSDMKEPSAAIASRAGLAQQIAQGGGQGSSLLHDSASDSALHAANEKVLTSPAVRRIAREEKVPLAHVKGTGPAGRILKEDVVAWVKAGRKMNGAAAGAAAAPARPVAAAVAPVSSSAASAPAKPAKVHAAPASYLPSDRVLPITGVNRIMVQTMTASNAIPQLGYGDEVCLDALYEVRAALNKEAQHKYGVKLSYMPFILKAASLALKHYPQLNAHTNADCSSVTHKAVHNLGMAMDTPRGLLVPNIKVSRASRHRHTAGARTAGATGGHAQGDRIH